MEEAWQQEREAAGHVVSAIRKQRAMNCGAQFDLYLSAFFLFSPGPRHTGYCCSQLSFATSVNPVQKVPHRHVQPELCPLAAIPDAVSMKALIHRHRNMLAFQVFLMHILLLTVTGFVVQKYFF